MKWIVAIGLTMSLSTAAHTACNTAGSYTNSNGDQIKTPRCAEDKSGATYRCGDASFSFAKHRRGACSGHDGLKDVLKPNG